MMLIVMIVVLLLLIAAVVVAANLGLIKLPAGGGKQTLPYCKKEYFFTKAEAAFYRVLTGAVGGEFLIFAKVRMCDLVDVVGQREGRQGHLNRVQSKHVDFVLCDPERIKPMLAIELDDSSHQRQSQQKNDAFKNEAFTAASLPLLRIPASRMYDQRKIAAEIESQLSPGRANECSQGL